MPIGEGDSKCDKADMSRDIGGIVKVGERGWGQENGGGIRDT